MKKDDSSEQWSAIYRGSIIASVISKHVNYIGLADRRAQTVITINSLIVPLALAGIRSVDFKWGAIIAIIGAITSITFAMISLLPKKYKTKGHEHKHLFHFSELQKFSEEEYMNQFRKMVSDKAEVGKMAGYDIYHMSKNVLKPKFDWLGRSYLVFIVGNSLALLVIILNTI